MAPDAPHSVSSVPAFIKFAMGSNGLLFWLKIVFQYLNMPPHLVAFGASPDTPGMLWAHPREDSALAVSPLNL